MASAVQRLKSRRGCVSGATVIAAVLLATGLLLAVPRAADAQRQGGSIFDDPPPGTPQPPRPPAPNDPKPPDEPKPPPADDPPQRPPPPQPPRPVQPKPPPQPRGPAAPSVPAPAGPPIVIQPKAEDQAYYGVVVEQYEDPQFEVFLRGDVIGTPILHARSESAGQRMSALLLIPKAGVYHFRIETRHTARMWVGDKVLINCDPTSPDSRRQAEVRLPAGAHPFGLEHVTAEGAADAPATGDATTLWWASGGRWQQVPREALRQPSVVSSVVGRKAKDLKLPQPLTDDMLAPGVWFERYAGPGYGRHLGVTPGSFSNATLHPGERFQSSWLFHGVLWAPKPGRYVFQIPAHIEVELEIDGKSILSHRGVEPELTKPAAVDLAEGPHFVRLRAENPKPVTQRENVSVLWQEPEGTGFVEVPRGALMHLRTVPPVRIADDKGRPITPPADPPLRLAADGKPLPAKADALTSVPPAAGQGGDDATMRPPAQAGGPDAGAPRAAAQQAPKVAVPRVSVPAEADVTAARKAVKTKYASYYADRKGAVQASLVQKLMDEAQGPAAKPPERYALLREAAEVAAGSGDVNRAMAAIAEAGRRFESDETELSVAVLSASVRGITKDTAPQWADRAMKLAEAAGDAGKYDLAAKALGVAEAAARLMGGAGASVVAVAKERTAAMRDLRAEEAKLKPVFEKLKASPDDPDSNMKAGKFYCLIINDWARGLQALGKAPQLELQALAELETSAIKEEKAGGTPDAGTRQKLGDAWWDVAAKDREPYAGKARLRAAHHYRRAIEATKDAAARDRMWDRMASSRRPVDLLAAVDLKRDALKGGAWGARGRELAVQSKDQHVLGFPYTPASEYDYLLDYSVLSTDQYSEIRQFLHLASGGAAAWNLATRGNHVTATSSTGIPTPKVATGGMTKGRHASLVRVRKDSIRVFLDGQLVVDWEVDTASLGGQRFAGLPAGLGLQVSRATVVLHAAKVTEVPDEPAPATPR